MAEQSHVPTMSMKRVVVLLQDTLSALPTKLPHFYSVNHLDSKHILPKQIYTVNILQMSVCIYSLQYYNRN